MRSPASASVSKACSRASATPASHAVHRGRSAGLVGTGLAARRERGQGIERSVRQRRHRRHRRDRTLGIDRRDRPSAHPCDRGGAGLGDRGRNHQPTDRGTGRCGAEDRRCGETHPRHRRADQSPGAQRHHRGGARRRGRARFCGGGLRGEIAGGADRQGDRGDRGANPRRAGLDHHRGQRHPQHRRPHAGNLKLHLGGRGLGRAAECRDRRNLGERRRRGAGHRHGCRGAGRRRRRATATRSSAETVLSAARSVESAVAMLRGEVETFLGKVAV